MRFGSSRLIAWKGSMLTTIPSGAIVCPPWLCRAPAIETWRRLDRARGEGRAVSWALRPRARICAERSPRPRRPGRPVPAGWRSSRPLPQRIVSVPSRSYQRVRPRWKTGLARIAATSTTKPRERPSKPAPRSPGHGDRSSRWMARLRQASIGSVTRNRSRARSDAPRIPESSPRPASSILTLQVGSLIA